MPVTDIRVIEQDLSSGDLELEARSDESIQVVARGVSGADTGTIIEEYIREELMFAFPADEGDENILLEDTVQTMHTDLSRYLDEHGFRAPNLAIPEGQTYTLASTTGSGTATLLYREQSPGSVNDSQPGAPGTKTRSFASSGEVTETIASGETDTFEVEESVQPAQLDDFPFSQDCPPNREYDMQAMMIGLSTDSGANVTLDGVRLTSEGTDFLARDSQFVDPALMQYPTIDLATMPMTFPDVPTFSPGEDLDITVSATNSGSGAEDAIVHTTVLFYRRSV